MRAPRRDRAAFNSGCSTSPSPAATSASRAASRGGGTAGPGRSVRRGRAPAWVRRRRATAGQPIARFTRSITCALMCCSARAAPASARTTSVAPLEPSSIRAPLGHTIRSTAATWAKRSPKRSSGASISASSATPRRRQAGVMSSPTSSANTTEGRARERTGLDEPDGPGSGGREERDGRDGRLMTSVCAARTRDASTRKGSGGQRGGATDRTCPARPAPRKAPPVRGARGTARAPESAASEGSPRHGPRRGTRRECGGSPRPACRSAPTAPQHAP